MKIALDKVVIKELNEVHLLSCFSLFHSLRPHLNYADFIEIFAHSKARDEYTLVGAYEKDICIGLIGFRILFDMVRGKHVYIDDLVVEEGKRSAGIGPLLLDYATQYAKENGCSQLRLCTGCQNTDAQRFYEREGWKPIAIAYTLSSN